MTVVGGRELKDGLKLDGFGVVWGGFFQVMIHGLGHAKAR